MNPITQEMVPEAKEPSAGLPFGIIDPDYARIFTQARIIAWQYGYSCSAQGSFTRDLDLLLVPWAENAAPDVSRIIARLAAVCGLLIQGEPSDKPHGRKAWTLKLPGFGEVRWVDVSAFVPPAKVPTEAIGELLAEAMNQAVANGTNSVSMPDGYVEIAAWLTIVKG